MSTDETQTPHSPPECAVCREPIGVYEPLIQVRGKLVRRTSRGAEPGVCDSGAACYHADCYDRVISNTISSAGISKQLDQTLATVSRFEPGIITSSLEHTSRS